MIIVRIIGTFLYPFIWLALKLEEGSIGWQITGILLFAFISWMGWGQTGVLGFLMSVFDIAALLVIAFFLWLYLNKLRRTIAQYLNRNGRE